jgi:predicted transcriptional regulator
VIGNGLLEYDSAKERYRTTERGLRLLNLYSNMSGLELAPYAKAPTQK